VRHFVQLFNRQLGKCIDTVPSETMNALIRYQWPGNIRELQNVIERAVILSRGPLLEVPTEELRVRVDATTQGQQDHVDLRSTLEDAERESILAALKKTNWKVAGPKGAAALLGMHRSTMQSRMKRLGIRISRSGA
jgi:formate hydrogenlyase transcriptional activator